MVAALLLVILTMGVGSQAFAAGSGNGNGNNGNGNGGSSASTAAGKDNGKAGDHGSTGTAGTSGDPSQPQPNSNADNNTGGANGQCPGGPYCSTRDGSPSGNGNGNGNAHGKPCAGCVGKADNKNPHGQMPNGSDHNNGYECDGNNGIGKTNPAHTGCTSTPPGCEQTNSCPTPPGCEASNSCPTPPGCEQSNSCPPPPGCEQSGNCPTPPGCEQDSSCPPTCVPAPGQDANCQQVPGKPRPPVVMGTHATAHSGASVLGASASVRPAAGGLPNTGAPAGLALVGLLGLGLVAAGGVTMMLRRRGSQ